MQYMMYMKKDLWTVYLMFDLIITCVLTLLVIVALYWVFKYYD